MSSFLQDNERALEEKFHHHKDFEFKIKSRRNRLFGLWIAQQIQLDQVEAEAYAKDLVALIFQNPSDEVLLEKALHDLKSKEKLFTAIQVQKQLKYCYEDARNQLLNVKKNESEKR